MQAVFVLPTVYPITPGTLNYSGGVVAVVLLITLWWWSPVYGARGWFKDAQGKPAFVFTLSSLQGIRSTPILSAQNQ